MPGDVLVSAREGGLRGVEGAAPYNAPMSEELVPERAVAIDTGGWSGV